MSVNKTYGFLDEMKEVIKHWWKANMFDWKIDKRVVKKFKEIVFHEIIHCKIVKNSAKTINITLQLEKLEKAEDGIAGFYYEASCVYTFPHKFNLPKYYPRFIFIQFRHFLFDVICDIFKFDIFTTFKLKFRLFKFLKCLKSFKVRS